MLIGIVSECTEEKRRRYAFLKYVKETVSDADNPFTFVSVRLPYTEDKFEQLSSKRRAAVLSKAIRILRMENVHSIVLSRKLKKYEYRAVFAAESMNVADGSSVFYRFVPDIVRRVTKDCSVNLLNAKVCISAAGQDRITEYLMRELCYDIKNLTIFTDDTRRIKNICESFAEDTGFFPQITDKQSETLKNADVFIDLDKNRVRIGRNVVIDGVEFEFNLSGYSVDMLDIAACFKEVDLSDRVISYNCGKNKLTLRSV